MSRTADELLEGIKVRISMVTSQALLQEDEILGFADKIIESRIVPLIMRSGGDFLVATYDQDLVASQVEYPIHYRSVGRTVREAQILDTDDNVVSDLPIVPLEDAYRYQQSTGGSWVCYFKGDKIVIAPPPETGTTDQLRQFYYLKPSRLIESTSARQVTAITSTTVTLSGDDLPDDMDTVGDEVDFIQQDSGCSLLAMDKAITNTAGQVLTFATGAIPTGLAVGDWVAPATKSPMIMLPDECFDLLEAMAAQRCLIAKSDFEGARELKEDIDGARKDLVDLLQPRLKGEPMPIVNERGLMRGRLGMRRYGIFSSISEE